MASRFRRVLSQFACSVEDLEICSLWRLPPFFPPCAGGIASPSWGSHLPAPVFDSPRRPWNVLPARTSPALRPRWGGRATRISAMNASASFCRPSYQACPVFRYRLFAQLNRRLQFFQSASMIVVLPSFRCDVLTRLRLGFRVLLASCRMQVTGWEERGRTRDRP